MNLFLSLTLKKKGTGCRVSALRRPITAIFTLYSIRNTGGISARIEVSKQIQIKCQLRVHK